MCVNICVFVYLVSCRDVHRNPVYRSTGIFCPVFSVLPAMPPLRYSSMSIFI